MKVRFADGLDAGTSRTRLPLHNSNHQGMAGRRSVLHVPTAAQPALRTRPPLHRAVAHGHSRAATRTAVRPPHVALDPCTGRTSATSRAPPAQCRLDPRKRSPPGAIAGLWAHRAHKDTRACHSRACGCAGGGLRASCPTSTLLAGDRHSVLAAAQSCAVCSGSDGRLRSCVCVPVQMRTVLYGKKAANLYTQAFVQNTQARALYQESEDTYYRANDAASYDDWRRARHQWDYFYNRH